MSDRLLLAVLGWFTSLCAAAMIGALLAGAWLVASVFALGVVLGMYWIGRGVWR